LDTTLRGAGYIVPDTDTHLYYLMNNSVSSCGGATLYLPHSTVVGAGRMVIVSPGNVPNSSGCPGAAVGVQGTDTLVPFGVNASYHPLVVVSDGLGHWIIINSGGR
jgi:hypothetical protein